MPPVLGHTITTDGFQIVSPRLGTYAAVITRVSNRTTVTMTVNGVVSSAPQITNATISAVETLLNNWLSGTVLGVGGGNLNGAFVAAVHVFTLAPLSVSCWVGNPGLTPPVDWWL
jgi:hypothetical protein